MPGVELGSKYFAVFFLFLLFLFWYKILSKTLIEFLDNYMNKMEISRNFMAIFFNNQFHIFQGILKSIDKW